MKKFLTALFIMLIAVVANAQTAIETPAITDNIYVGVGGGATTPLDLNSVFPLNGGAKVVIGKNLTPVIGIEAEGVALFNDNHFGDIKTIVKATNVSISSTINLSNLIAGYKGKPRWFEFRTNAGFGWMHTFDKVANYLTAKTALDVVWNIGHSRAVSVVVSPGVYWNINGFDSPVRTIMFNKHSAELAVFGTLTYNFKNRNGLRYFKKYDIGAYEDTIAKLKEAASKIPDTVTVTKTVEVLPETTPAAVIAPVNPYVVFFATNSAELTPEAKATLDNVQPAFVYDIAGYASPEGSEELNNALSQKRAEEVAKYLNSKNIKTGNVEGKGVAHGPATNRVSVITAK